MTRLRDNSGRVLTFSGIKYRHNLLRVKRILTKLRINVSLTDFTRITSSIVWTTLLHTEPFRMSYTPGNMQKKENSDSGGQFTLICPIKKQAGNPNSLSWVHPKFLKWFNGRKWAGARAYKLPGQVYTSAHNTLILVVIKRVVKQAAGHCAAVLLRSCPFSLLVCRQCQPEATSTWISWSS